jgi:hypothetical protein
MALGSTSLVLERHGPLEVAFSPGCTPAMKAALLAHLPDPSRKEPPAEAQILKRARQRLVLRLLGSDLPEGRCVAKMFPLKNLVSRFRHRKYARREYLNTLTAEARGMAVPRVYAFLQRRRLSLVLGAGLIMQDLHSHRDIRAVARDCGGFLLAAEAAVPALVALYMLGINHVDARDENILVAQGTDPATGFAVIDWQYATFVTPRTEWLLEYLCAYFVRMAPPEARAPLVGDWLQGLHTRAEHPLAYPAFAGRVERLLAARPTTRARLRLRPLA